MGNQNIENSQHDGEQEVTIKLKRQQIPDLVGAARLAIRALECSDSLWHATNGSFLAAAGMNEYLIRYMMSVGNIIKGIKEQTNIKEETTDEGYFEAIDNLVTNKCKIYENEGILRWYEEEGEKIAEEYYLNNPGPGVVSLRISEEDVNKVETQVREIMNVIHPKDH